MSQENACPICSQGVLEAQQEQNAVTYKGVTKCLPMRFSVCSCCGSETASSTDLRENKRVSNCFKKQVDGFLTGAEVREIRTECWGISQATAANIFGGGPKAFSKYESDDVIQSEAMDKLMRVAHAIPEAFSKLKKLSGEDTRVEQSTVLTVASFEWSETPSEVDNSVLVSPSNPQAMNAITYRSSKNWIYKDVA